MHIRYRLFDGTLTDAAAVLAVEAVCWNQSPHGPSEALEVLQRTGSVCWLATDESGGVVGFVHCFPTVGPDAKIWEVDLLAVHPAYRRMGIGTELVRRAAGSAPQDAELCRAFVSVHNVASSRAFARVGFGRSDSVYEIFMRRVRPTDSALASPIMPEPLSEGVWMASLRGRGVVYKEVYTLLYRGLWMEGIGGQTPEALIEAGLALAARRGLGEAGPVIARSDWAARRKLRRMEFWSLGEYHAYTLSGRAGTV
jgi:ribosomal protein S18 acetylase RimI-like enzyme